MLQQKRLWLVLVLCLCGTLTLAADGRKRTRRKAVQLPLIEAPIPARPNPPRPFYEVDDPTVGPNFKFPNPPGAAEIRAALMRQQPVPNDRLAYYAPLDHDPLAEQYVRNGWWLSVDRVERQPDGSLIADVQASVKFDHTNAALFARVSGVWIERYQLQGGQLTYLGGHFKPQMEMFRTPFITVNTH